MDIIPKVFGKDVFVRIAMESCQSNYLEDCNNLSMLTPFEKCWHLFMKIDTFDKDSKLS